MTKYCKFFVRNKLCRKKNCPFIHEFIKQSRIHSENVDEGEQKLKRVNKKRILKTLIKQKFNFSSLVSQDETKNMSIFPSKQKVYDYYS